MELPDESDEERSSVYPLHLPGRRWPDEEPSDPRAEVWEKLWDACLHQNFLEWRRAEDSAAATRNLEKLAEEMAQKIGEELYPKDKGSVNREGSEEEVDYYKAL